MLPGLEGTPNGVPRPTGSVGVSGSNPLCSTILEKSEPNPDWEWVRISLFPLKYRGVIDF